MNDRIDNMDDKQKSNKKEINKSISNIIKFLSLYEYCLLKVYFPISEDSGVLIFDDFLHNRIDNDELTLSDFRIIISHFYDEIKNKYYVSGDLPIRIRNFDNIGESKYEDLVFVLECLDEDEKLLNYKKISIDLCDIICSEQLLFNIFPEYFPKDKIVI